MLLAIDIGNTEVTLGLFEGKRIVLSYRVSSQTRHTADEAALLLRQVAPELGGANGPADAARKAKGSRRAAAKGHDCVIASAVPPQTSIFSEAVRQLRCNAPHE